MDISDLSFNVQRVNVYRKFFEEYWENKLTKNRYEIITNLSHSFQYLEFLSICLSKELHSGVQRQMIKSFVICGSSIIETLIHIHLDVNNLFKKSEWNQLTDRRTKKKYLEHFDDLKTEYKKTIDGKDIKITLKFEEKLKSPKKNNPNLNSMIEILKSKKVFGEDDKIYNSLIQLKNQRNKVHLNNIRYEFDHDWSNFKIEDGTELKKILIEIIKSKPFNFPLESSREIFGFLILQIHRKTS